MNIIREAGWGIWPVLGFGLWALVVAVWNYFAPREGNVKTVGFLVALTLVAGMLGTALGVQVSAEHIGEVAPDERWIFLLGLKESLQNMVVASVLSVLCLLALLLTHLRAARPSAVAGFARRAARSGAAAEGETA